MKRIFKPPLLILQVQVEGYVPEYTGGPMVEGQIRQWWVDAKPEWLLEDKLE